MPVFTSYTNFLTVPAVIAAGAVAICGASAALAIASVLPKKDAKGDAIALSIIGVTALSSFAMLGYPALAHILQMQDAQAGIFFGATIHDVAQVVGAGALVSPEATETSAIVKLMRVACLVPVILIISFLLTRRTETGILKNVVNAVPVFMIAFCIFVGANSAGLVLPEIGALANGTSQVCLVLAIGAIGIKTTLYRLPASGGPIFLTLSLTTLLLGGGVLGVLAFFHNHFPASTLL